MIAVLNRHKVVNLFKEYFGEDRVDNDGSKIIVWWPGITISNEKGQSSFIKDLYARVYVDNRGCLAGAFALNRASYSYNEWVSKYRHSHIPRLTYRTPDSLRDWGDPCLGTGPIRQTSAMLNHSYDEDVWRLFIFELDQYVRHESLEGGPYTTIANIGINYDDYRSHLPISIPKSRTIKPEVPYYLKNTLNFTINSLITEIVRARPFKFNYIHKSYGIAESAVDILIKTSNIYIEWYNGLPVNKQKEVKEFLDQRNLFRQYKMVDNKLYVYNDNNNTHTAYYLPSYTA